MMNQNKFIFSLLLIHILGSVCIYPMKNKENDKKAKTCKLKAICCDSHPNGCRNFDTLEEFNEHVDTGVNNYITILKPKRKMHLSLKKEEWICRCPWKDCTRKSPFVGTNWSRNLKIHVIAKHGGVRPYKCQWDKECTFEGVTRDHLVKHMRTEHLYNNPNKKREALDQVNTWYKRKKKENNTAKPQKIDQDQSSSIELDYHVESCELIEQYLTTEEGIISGNTHQLVCYQDFILSENKEILSIDN